MAAAPFGPGEREGTKERGDAAGEEEERGDTRREGEARERLGGSRRWPRPLGRAPRLGPSGEEEDDRGSGDGLGHAGPGRWRQVS